MKETLMQFFIMISVIFLNCYLSSEAMMVWQLSKTIKRFFYPIYFDNLIEFYIRVLFNLNWDTSKNYISSNSNTLAMV